ncbi:MAG: hypothetical protein ACTTJS_06295 [Wolinella sp.]
MIITPVQLLALADLADRFAKPHLHVTTRAGVQLRYARLHACHAIQ